MSDCALEKRAAEEMAVLEARLLALSRRLSQVEDIALYAVVVALGTVTVVSTYAAFRALFG